MSKSIWCDAVDSKPVRADDKPHKTIKVLFWVRDQPLPYWGDYDHNLSLWFGENQGYFNESDVKYFAYIDNPYK